MATIGKIQTDRISNETHTEELDVYGCWKDDIGLYMSKERIQRIQLEEVRNWKPQIK
jgi:hypothetical protein